MSTTQNNFNAQLTYSPWGLTVRRLMKGFVILSFSSTVHEVLSSGGGGNDVLISMLPFPFIQDLP